jgi:hypothetical protein
MINIIQNTIGALGRVLGIIRKNLQLWLDFNKSEVIGSEEVVNGTFDTDLTDWVELDVGVMSYNDGLKITKGATGNARVQSAPNGSGGNLTEGATYKLTFKVTENNDCTSLFVWTGSGYTNTNSALVVGETYNFIYTFSGSSYSLYFNNLTANSDITLDDISLKEVTQFVMDKSPNTNNAKLFTGKALSFNGDDSVTGMSVLDGYVVDSNSKFTIATTFKATSLGSEMIFSTGQNGDNRFYLWTTGGNLHLSFGQQGSATPTTGTMPTLSVDTVYRVIVSVDGLTATVSLDGLEVYTRTNSLSFTLEEELTLGVHGSQAAFYYNGLLSNIQYYNKAWTASDVAFDYNNPNHLAIDNPDTSLVVTDLKGYWALSEGDGLVAYDSGSTLEEDVVQNGDFSELGVELITNGDFSTDTDWNVNSNWSISGGVANADGTSDLDINQGTTLATIGSSYRITYEVVSISQGEFFFKFGGINGEFRDSIGIYTEVVQASNTNRISLDSTHNVIGSVTNISVKQVDPNNRWNLGTGWSYGDDKVTCDGVGYNTFTQSIGDLVGKKLQLEFEIKDWVSGTIRVPEAKKVSGSNIRYSGNGTYVETYTAALDNLGLQSALFNGSITNISLTEITPSDHGGLVVGATYVDKQPTIPQLGMMDWAKGSNLITYSQNFAEWSVFDDVSTVANYGVSPDGTQNSFKVSSLGGGNDFTYLSLTITASQTFTVSFFIKNIDCLKSVFWNPSESQIEIDWNGATISSIGTGANFESVGNGWYKITSTSISNADSSYVTRFYPSKTPNAGSIELFGYQLEESSSAGNYILTDGAAAIDVTTIQNPTNKGFDILGNALRLRENAFNLDGSGYAEVAISSSLTNVTNGTIQFWLKNTKTTTFVIFNESSTTNYLGAWNGSGNFYNDSASGTITQYADSNSTVTSAKITDGTWHLYTFTGIDLSLFDKLEISNYGTGSSLWLDCIIDEVVVYDRVLTSKEITNNYKFGLRTHS